MAEIASNPSNQASGELVEAQKQGDAVADLDDFGKVMEEFMEMLELDSDDDKKTKEKKTKKNDKSDNLAQAEKIFSFLETNDVKIKEALKALAEGTSGPGKPNIPLPKMISELKGSLDGPEGTGNPWLAKSMMTDLITIMMELIPILSRIKLEETKNELKINKEQHDVTVTIGKAQIHKAELEAEQLRLDAVKQFVSAGVTIGTMIGSVAMTAANTVKGAASTVKGAASSAAGAVKGAASSVGSQAAGAAKGAMGSKGAGDATGEGMGDFDDEGADWQDTGFESTDSTQMSQPGSGQAASATNAANSSKAGEGAGSETGGAGPGEQSKLSKIGDAVKNASDSLGTGNSTSKTVRDSSMAQQRTLETFGQMGKIGEGIAGGVVDSMKAILKAKTGFVDAEISMLNHISQILTRAAESAKEEKRSAADMIGKVFENMQKLIEAMAAFRITR